MSQSILQMEKDFLDYNKKISAYNEALALIYWDLRTGAPKAGDPSAFRSNRCFIIRSL